MPDPKRFPSLYTIIVVLTFVVFTSLLLVNYQSSAQVERSTGENTSESRTEFSLPDTIQAALSTTHGNFENLINKDDLLSDLQEVDIVLIGEAHYDQRDIQTAFEMARMLAQKRQIALAVERFPLNSQPSLSALNNIEGQAQRIDEIKRILLTDDYQTVWGLARAGNGGFSDPNEPVYPTNSPSAQVFESMMIWAACERIPIIGLDLPLTDRKLGLGENIPYRNNLWKNQIINFMEQNQSEDYLVIVIGGINHLSNGLDSVQEKFRNDPSSLQLLSIGQRDVNFPSKTSQTVEDLASNYLINDLIVQNPEFAGVQHDGSPLFANPPEYWIAVHLAGTWEKLAGCSLN
jgi:hypothetical protein